MKLARRHFEFIADTLYSCKPHLVTNEDALKRGQWTAMAIAFADACARYNPEFKRDRFLTACGLGTTED